MALCTQIRHTVTDFAWNLTLTSKHLSVKPQKIHCIMQVYLYICIRDTFNKQKYSRWEMETTKRSALKKSAFHPDAVTFCCWFNLHILQLGQQVTFFHTHLAAYSELMLQHHLPLKFILEYFVHNSLHSKQYQSSDKTKSTHDDESLWRFLKMSTKTFNNSTIYHHLHLQTPATCTACFQLVFKLFNLTINDSC